MEWMKANFHGKNYAQSLAFITRFTRKWKWILSTRKLATLTGSGRINKSNKITAAPFPLTKTFGYSIKVVMLIDGSLDAFSP